MTFAEIHVKRSVIFHVLKTAMAAVSNALFHISLLNSSQKASRYATRRQINPADGGIVAYAF